MNPTSTRIATFVSILVLVACATKTEPPNPVLVPETKQVSIPESTLKKCAVIPHLEQRKYSEGELVDFANSVIKLSEACRSRQSLLADTVRDAFNLPKPAKQPSK